ncbi:MAG: hypothetical protein AUI14_12785 [Actinobacteria bacterium 13_2_20CM_2_71_6]|nr:MAG: hypothetical protein AUI14_12785 [Actinobacteria bacterium 13_2_20CM_2_71_6]
MLRDIRQPVPIDGVPVATSASLGIALAPEHADTPERMLACADVAMYHAKRTGSPYHLYNPEQDRDNRYRLSLESALHGAIDRGEVTLQYQPIISIASGDLIGVEALARWHHNELGPVPPDQFVPLAEQTGLIHPLTLHLLDRALRQCVEWRASGLPLRVSVNLSPLNCTDAQLPDRVEQLLAHYRLPAYALRLEITERAALEPEAQPVLARLHRLGVSLALDDFGTGYSSLSHLKVLPIDDVKIDRGFIQALTADPTDDVIIRATVLMAQALGRTVTAEGVEDVGTLRALRRLGVHTAQGYLISPALPPDELAGWARNRQAGAVDVSLTG